MTTTKYTTPTPAPEVCDEQIKALLGEAAQHGDGEMAALCLVALDGEEAYEDEIFGRPVADMMDSCPTQAQARCKCAAVISAAAHR